MVLCSFLSVDELAAVVEWVRTGELPDVARVRDQAQRLAPHVYQEGGWLHGERRRRRLAEIEHDLVRRAGGGHDQGAVPARLDGAMEVAAEHALHLAMSLDHLAEALTPLEPEPIHVPDPRPERRVMHDDDRG